MKKQFILIATMLLTISFNAHSNSVDRMIVKIKKAESDKTLNVQLANLENEKTVLNLYDEKGIGWFSKTVKNKNGFAAEINLNGLPDGDYILAVKKNSSVHIQAISLEEEGITFFQDPSTFQRERNFAMLTSTNAEVNKSRVISRFTKEEGQKVGVQISNMQEKPVSIKLIGLCCGQVLSKDISGEHGYGAKWDLKGMNEDFYYFLVYTEDATVIQYFKLNNDGAEMISQQRVERVRSQKTILAAK
ncbi:MAG: hypothetical protein KJO29_06340 [Bacteroidia bacterium]|nr:hypothetical protein [Bacteroidia bacterium]